MSRIFSLLLVLILVVAAFFLFRSVNTSSPSGILTEKEKSDFSLPKFEKWREFLSADSHFRVLLPSLPQHVKDKFADPITNEPRKHDAFVTTESGQSVFMISAITLPQEIKQESETNAALKAILDQLVSKNPDNHLAASSMGKFRIFPSIDFLIVNGDAVIGGKAFIDKHVIYILTMGNDKKMFNQNELNFFINSFQVIDTDKENETNNK